MPDTRFIREIDIKTIDDLENYLWEEIGILDMEHYVVSLISSGSMAICWRRIDDN